MSKQTTCQVVSQLDCGNCFSGRGRAHDESSSCSSRSSMSATVSRKIASTRGSSAYRSAARKRIIRSRNQVASDSLIAILTVPITHPRDLDMVCLPPSNSRDMQCP